MERVEVTREDSYPNGGPFTVAEARYIRYRRWQKVEPDNESLPPAIDACLRWIDADRISTLESWVEQYPLKKAP